MGYNTDYNLSTDLAWECPAEYEHDDRLFPVYASWRGGWDGKWYDHEDDMREVSKKFPTITFRLEGQGEEKGDWWVKYFRMGKMQTYEAEIPPFDKTRKWT